MEKLNKVERAILANQFRILAFLDETNGAHLNKKAEIAEYGYEGLYGELLDHIYDGVDNATCDETFDILTMFRAIQNTISGLTDEEKETIDLDMLKFQGFDANNDKHYGFMEFLVEKEGRYKGIANLYRNSHSISTIRIYRGLLGVYRERIRHQTGPLTLEDLQEMCRPT